MSRTVSDHGTRGNASPSGRRPVRSVSCLVSVLLLVIGLAFFLGACGPAETTTTGLGGPSSTSPVAPSQAATTTSTTTAPIAARGYAQEPPYLDPQPVDLSLVAGLEKAGLTEMQQAVLARQGFVAVSDPVEQQPWQFWQLYERARYQGIPLLVTTDSILNAYHMLFDTILQRLEEDSLYAQARVMTQALAISAYDQWARATDETVKEDARRNVGYFAVAAALLEGAASAPEQAAPIVGAEVEAELALIEAAAGLADSPLLSYTEDYSHYKPRGHYTRSQNLQRYFKAMMWYGHTGFFINPREPDLTDDEAASLTRRAVLVSSSLVGPAREAWAALYDPTSFLIGLADDLTVDNLQLVLTDVFGTAVPEPDDLGDGAKMEALREALNKLPAPKILSATVRAPGDTENREENERSFRVMGQRYIPDSYAFQQLVWAYVGEDQPDMKRDMPMGLDVMTVLGSDQAYRIAKEDFAQDRYQNWESQIEKVNREFSGREGGLWPANLYTGWLESLQEVMAFPAAGAPDFMKSRVWARKSLNTALGSWTELRHDTILYAKQSVVAEGEGGEEGEMPGYVEPYPVFYGKIAELAGRLRTGLTDYGLGDAEIANKLDLMVELADTLRSIAEKQLAGEELSQTEHRTIQEYGHYLEMLGHFTDSEEGRTLSPAAEKSALVADVHTSLAADPATGAISNMVLEEATGYPLTLYIAFEAHGRLQLFVGAAYSYYEFPMPLDRRLTDEEWIDMLDTGRAPLRPFWTNEWIIDTVPSEGEG